MLQVVNIKHLQKNKNKKVRKKVLAIIEEKHEKNVCQLQTKKVTAVATWYLLWLQTHALWKVKK
jgi:hypothetical protein